MGDRQVIEFVEEWARQLAEDGWAGPPVSSSLPVGWENRLAAILSLPELSPALAALARQSYANRLLELLSPRIGSRQGAAGRA
jgi:hypothetical protein